jgi:hypothetical protein
VKAATIDIYTLADLSVWLEDRQHTTHSYKPSPQAQYLVERMTELDKTLLDVVTKLSKKMDSYEKCITSLSSNLAKVQSQVNLSMWSIRALQKEHVLLVQTMNPSGTSSSVCVLQVELWEHHHHQDWPMLHQHLYHHHHHLCRTTQTLATSLYILSRILGCIMGVRSLSIDGSGHLKWIFLSLMGLMLEFGWTSVLHISISIQFHQVLELLLHPFT